MTAPTYPRIDPENPWVVEQSDTNCFECESAYDAMNALRALQDAFIAGQQDILAQWREAQNSESAGP